MKNANNQNYSHKATAKNQNNAQMRKSNEQVADVPNPPTPNRAHTDMKAQGKKCGGDSCNVKYDSKNK